MNLFEKELHHRLDILAKAQALDSWPLLSPSEVRDLGIYGGASGVWVDKTRTQEFAQEGVAVGAHLRVKDHFKGILPAIVMLAISTATLATSL